MSDRRHVFVVGAGLAGLCAATAALEDGATVTIAERDDEPGGASSDSAGWIWRYRDVAIARLLAPHADPDVQAAIVERLDEDLAWLQLHHVKVLNNDTGREATRGIRIDPHQAVGVLADRIQDREASGDAQLLTRSRVIGARHAPHGTGVELCVRRRRAGDLPDAPDEWIAADAVVFAGGGYAGDLPRIAEEAHINPDIAATWTVRTRWAGDGSSMDAALALGALRMPPTGESLVRLVPHLEQTPEPHQLVRFSELHLPDSELCDAHGATIARSQHDWSGAQVCWTMAQRCGVGRLVLSRAHLRERVHAGTVEDIIREAIGLGMEAERGPDGEVVLPVRAGFTHTLCGVRIDSDGQVLARPTTRRLGRSQAPRPITAVYAAGADAAGHGLGGTASGLAQALVLGRSAGSHAAQPG